MRLPMIALAALLAGGCGTPDDGSANTAATTPADTPTPRPTPHPSTASPPAREAADTTVPKRFQGEYAADTAACTSPGHESRLVIGAWRIKFHESAGAIIAVDNDRNALSITAELTGEGETRRATYHFNLSDDGQTLTDTDSGMARRRC